MPRKKAGETRKNIQEYFDNLKETLLNIPPDNIINYDETGGRIPLYSAGQQTPHPDGARPSSPVIQTPAADPPRSAKRSRSSASAIERADMVDALKRSTDAIISRKPKHECLVCGESI